MLTQFRTKKKFISIFSFALIIALSISIVTDNGKSSLQVNNLSKCLMENSTLPMSHAQHPCNQKVKAIRPSWSSLITGENTSLHFQFLNLVELLHYDFKQDNQ